jgi:hypothetical protein
MRSLFLLALFLKFNDALVGGLNIQIHSVNRSQNLGDDTIVSKNYLIKLNQMFFF